ncbi:hypothetical protein KFE25_001002 [Diacronema lutheri]|uniref:WD repeat-containing protein 74 n=1 Tax=Diacronema lutheri TaxID=2081491 RepID=A0A8J5X6U6_DIALT|nr:hypothetical protein KFE25_001002 [Diacronema lutheri]
MICGDDTGLCKRVADVDGRVVARWGEQAAGAAVHRLCARGPLACCGRHDGSVDAFELLADSTATPRLVHAYAGDGRAQVSGLALVGDARLLVADVAGRLEVMRAPGARDVSAHGDAAAARVEMGAHTAQVRVDVSGAHAASGGRDNELRVWDLDTLVVSWKARNVPEDSVRLDVPVWHADLAFAPRGAHVLATASGLVEQRLRGEVRLYDVRAQRRPVMRAIAPLGDVALSALALSPDATCAYIGTAKGGLGQLDLRRAGALLGSLKGAGGAITAVEVTPDGSRVFSASLDRHVRVHAARSRALIRASYVKQRVCALALLLGDGDEAARADGGEEMGERGGEAEQGARDGERRARRDARDADSAAVAHILGGLARASDGLAGDETHARAEDARAGEAAAAARARPRAKRGRAAEAGALAHGADAPMALRSRGAKDRANGGGDDDAAARPAERAPSGRARRAGSEAAAAGKATRTRGALKEGAYAQF